MSGESVLRSEGLSIGYQQPVLSGIEIDFGRGQLIALLGPNGAGKTTLLRTLSRHIKPLAGRIEILGQDLDAIDALDLARAVSVCLTDNDKPPLLSVGEFVALGRYPHTGFMGRLSPRDVDVVRESLAAVAASDLAGRPVERLSDGERQKAVLARALAQEPKLMLLDEPTAHLDLKHRVEVMGILRSLCRTKGLTVLASLHDIDIAAKVADRVLLVQQERRCDYGLPEALLTSERVASLYGIAAADFDSRLGGLEFRGHGRSGRAFVIAGQGRGALLFRLLSKKGLSIETGVLDEGDLDAFVARALGATSFVRPARRAGAPCAALAAALEVLPDCDLVVDCGAADRDAEIIRVRSAEYGLPFFRLGETAGAGGGETFHGQHGKHYASLAELSAAIDRFQRTGQRTEDRGQGTVQLPGASRPQDYPASPAPE
ncbi:MAG: ABC transporter ATP-binding protein [Candidatus Accumulibacter sp.]|jgi:iron complex transport system ATP-binding protein|nr:ABC transporter ATP-binding protein [Accumulibacter sp.]